MKLIQENRRAIIAAIPIILVNGVAFSGQFAYIRDHIHWILIGQIAFALALESVAVYLAYMAHEALKAEDAAYGLRIASYGFGFIIGILNYSHYANHMRPTFEAIATGLMSVASPWLWGIYSRRNSRDVLKAKGLIEPKAVKLGFLRWILWRNESFQVFRNAVWSGENNPITAISDWEEKISSKPESEPEVEMTLATAKSQADAIRIALKNLGIDAKTSNVISYLADNTDRKWDVSSTRVRQIRGEMKDKEIDNRRKDIRALPGGNG